MQNQKDTPSQVALNYIKSFKKGIDFIAPSSGIIINGYADADALHVLKEHLETENANVRENIVNLLVDLGLRSNGLRNAGAKVISNRSIIKILASEGLIKPDLGRERALDALRKLVMEADLAPFEDNFISALQIKASEEVFLLIAKAKTLKAKALVYQRAQLGEWKDVEAVKIVQAALGDENIVVDFTNKLKNANAANNARDFSKALRPLSLIGTMETLKLIAEYLRTPLTIDVPGAYEKSVRLDVLEALRYNFPDQLVLYPNNINSETDFTAAEKFCMYKFGVVYNTAPPPFLTYRGYPIPMSK